MYINSFCERVGKLNLKGPTEQIMQKQSEVKQNLVKFGLVSKQDEPNIKINMHCHDPFECSFSRYCFASVLKISLLNLYRIKQAKVYYMYHKRIVSYDDVKNSVEPSKTQVLQVKAKSKPHIEKDDIKNFISSIKYPINFLDFETFVDAVSIFDGQRQYMQILFQYSLHILHKNGTLEHFEF